MTSNIVKDNGVDTLECLDRYLLQEIGIGNGGLDEVPASISNDDLGREWHKLVPVFPTGSFDRIRREC
jgi:hypothetical protein